MRKTDIEICRDYHKLMNYSVGFDDHPQWLQQLLENQVKRAREFEPRINCAEHYADYLNICDEDDDFDSFYGENYFEKD